jgi:glycosyltransferase involved in cell wall biosynthesis
VGGPVVRDRFTTVADWRGYGYLEFEGQILGPKAEEFQKFLDLPRLAGEGVGIALNIDPEDEDLPLLRSSGWVVESPDVVSDPGRYRDFVAGSVGEFSCVKGGYAGTNSGWFSDRSACYLAAGRPVVLQATGFADLLPTGRGLFSVATAEEAAEAIRAVRRDYALHSAAARAIAAEHFDSRKVVGRLLKDLGLGGDAP